MCGIAAAYGPVDVHAAVAELHHRGPDAWGVKPVGQVTLGHTRLAILDLDPRSDQPFTYGRTTITYNGELWNFRAVRALLEGEGLKFRTEGDTEVVAAALDHWGPEALPRLNGMFAICWTDGDTLWAARDRYGEIPLHAARTTTGTAFASELRAIRAMTGRTDSIWIEPGEIMTVTSRGIQRGRWYSAPAERVEIGRLEAETDLRSLIDFGCFERAISDVPVCTLLSGGIDSAAIALHLKDHVPNLVAFTAVFNPTSRDARCARETAEALDIPLVEVPVTLPTEDDLRAVVDVVEMPYKAQVEIGWACLALAREMRSQGFKVVFSGEGSDELWASYGFAYHAMNEPGFDWHRYRRDLFLSQHRKNFARCNKIFLAHGVECRLPFLHPPLVEFALSVPQELCYEKRPVEKRLIRGAYDGILPRAVTDRPKEAFQDGLGLKAAISESVPDALRVYRTEYARRFPGAQ